MMRSRSLVEYVDALNLPDDGVRPLLVGPHAFRRPRLPDVPVAMRIVTLAEEERSSPSLSALAQAVLAFFDDPLDPEAIWALRRVRDSL